MNQARKAIGARATPTSSKSVGYTTPHFQRVDSPVRYSYGNSHRPAAHIIHQEMTSLIWKYIEVAGESQESFVDAVKAAILEAGKTVRGMSWFEVTSLRGRITKNKVESFQVAVKIGFKVKRQAPLHAQKSARTRILKRNSSAGQSISLHLYRKLL
jgi:flavin-binding protein dodecin